MDGYAINLNKNNANAKVFKVVNEIFAGEYKNTRISTLLIQINWENSNFFYQFYWIFFLIKDESKSIKKIVIKIIITIAETRG